MHDTNFYDYLKGSMPFRVLAILTFVISIPFWGLLLWILTNPAFYAGGYRDLWPFTCLWQEAGEGIIEKSMEADIPIRSQHIRYFQVDFKYHLTKDPTCQYQGSCYCLDEIEKRRKSLTEGKTVDVLIFNGNSDIAKLKIPSAVSSDIRPNRLYAVGGFCFSVPLFITGMLWLEYCNGKRCIQKGGPKRIRYRKKRRKKGKKGRK